MSCETYDVIHSFGPGSLTKESETELANSVLKKKIQNTQEIKENAFQLDKTGQNVQILEEVLFFNLRTA